MLFSNETVAKFIDEHYEAAWESVRPVPIIHMDFGNGKTITRTLNGNIATYLCAPDGQVIDVVCGINCAETFLDRLEEGARLATAIKKEARIVLKDYHSRQAQALGNGKKPGRLARLSDLSKKGIEQSLFLLFLLDTKTTNAEMSIVGRRHLRSLDLDPFEPRREEEKVGLRAPKHLELLLAEDTKLNETERRVAIHKLLADGQAVKPHDIHKRIYRDILHADLDDPYLGLGHLVWVGPQPPLAHTP